MAITPPLTVNVIEQITNTSVPALPTTIMGYVGDFTWGPCNQIMTIGNDKELEDIFGQPNENNYVSFYCGWNFLQYANSLKVVRVVDEADAKNAGLEVNDSSTTGTSAVSALIQNSEKVEEFAPSFGANAKLQIFAKYPGTKGNNIKVAIANYADFATAEIVSGTAFIDTFDYAPESDQIAIAVLVDDVLIEKHIVSFTEGAKDYAGNNIYVEDYINRGSSWILAFDKTTNTTQPDSILATALTLGYGDAATNTEITAGYDLFDNKEDVDVNMIIDGPNTNATIQQYIIDNLLETRKDCVGYFTVSKDSVVGVANISTAISNCLNYRSITLARSTTYGALYPNWKYQYDKYNDKYRWLPLSADVAGITALTHYTRDPWISPDGYNRGIIKNTTKLAINPKESHRTTLYQNFINTAYRDKDAGFVVLGQKTLKNTPSPFSRLDNRWLFVTIERSIAAAAKYFLSEKNTPFTRRQFLNVVNPYLKDVQGREGIEAFYVQCDEVVNNATVRERNEMVAYVFIKPTYTIETINLYFTNVGGNISFEEVIKKSA